MIGNKNLVLDKTIWLTTCMLFLAGIALPMFSLNQFVVFHDKFSLFESVVCLLKEKEWFLSTALFVFSILAPAYKLYLLGILLRNKETDTRIKAKIIKKLAIISKWSMADVFVVAIIVSTVKLGIIANVTVHIGIVFFGLAVLLSMLLVHRQMSKYEFKEKGQDTGKEIAEKN